MGPSLWMNAAGVAVPIETRQEFSVGGSVPDSKFFLIGLIVDTSQESQSATIWCPYSFCNTMKTARFRGGVALFVSGWLSVSHVSAVEKTENTRRLKIWKQTDFPNPESAPDQCGASSRMCDPDRILRKGERDEILKRIKDLEQSQGVSCLSGNTDTMSSSEPLQFAIALASQVRAM